MKKKLYLCLLLLLSISLGSDAQNTATLHDFFNRPTRKALSEENALLKETLDSLQSLVDSLEQRIYFDENIIVQEIEESEDSILFDVEYTAEVSDSLLHLWYKTSFSGEFDAVNEYNMDSVSFSSNISDEEMISRLENMNSFITLPFNSNVKNYIILYSERMPSQMGRVLGLSTYYFPIFEEVFVTYGLPVELKYLAVVESMLNPIARSRAGALGMWQFMYNTARSYNLEINSFVDERLDVEKAVDAAARYLRDAYKIFGDWSLAISSYNCGAGNVSKAIRRAGGKRDFWSIYPYLPKETRGYVPAFVAAMYAMTYSREYGLVAQEVGMPAKTDTFEIRRNLHFDQISAKVGITIDELKNLNPKYVHNIIPGNTHPYILKLPYNWTNAFVEVDRDSLYAYKADSLLSPKVVQSMSVAAKNPGRISYRVKNGDYLGRIATKYGVSVAKIKSWNNLKSSNIRVGQVLYIYGASDVPAPSSTTSTAKPSSSSASTTKNSSNSSTNSTSSSGYTIYVVKDGDSLYTIAKKYSGVSAENIRQYNGLKNNNIRPGQKLKIPNP